jgi:exopolysaccharide production protein ExoY
MTPTLPRLLDATVVDDSLRRRRPEFWVKRAIDVVGAAVLLVLASPLLILVALLVVLDSPGPVLFSQERWGWRGRVFRCYKFRSMWAGAATVASADGRLLKDACDARVTRVGRVLRRTSIDELPQLWNVLVGDMSLVGPRPLMLHMLEPYPALRELRCKVRPGITGLWQVRDRENNTHVAAMAYWDLEYIRRGGLVLDTSILFRTIGVVFGRRGAL